MTKRLLVLTCSVFLIVPLLFMGCSGDNGTNGVNGINGTNGTNGINGTDLTAVPEPESCAVCHGAAGTEHQAGYDLLYQDNVITASITSAVVTGNTAVVTFSMAKSGAAFSCSDADNLNIYFAPYDNSVGRFQFASGQGRLSIKGTLAYVGAGVCTSTSDLGANAALLADPGFVVIYGYDEQLGSTAARVRQVKFPYAALLPNAAYSALPNPFVPPSNVKGCEKCHTVPYLKHGNIYGRTAGNAATDMITCKACHLDNGEGGHQVWQMLVDDTARAGDLWALAPGDVETVMTPAELIKYAYTTRLMNDVHMSHAMEFEYPQSMSTCNTCHEGKLTTVLSAANFVVETCKSCHAVTGDGNSEKPQPSLAEMWATAGVSSFHNVNQTCNTTDCHAAGGNGKSFVEIHNGYDKKIYVSAGVKYSSVFSVTIDNASFAGNVLTIGFSAKGSAAGLGVDNIAPTVLVGLYGWDTKDYLFGPHERTIDSSRDIEYVVGATHPRFTTVTASGGSWTVTANLANWATQIAAGDVKRVEIAVMPKLVNAAGVTVALNAPSRTFDLTTGAFVNFYPAIVNVEAGCNNCHDALATNYHSADRSGNIVVCRLCHITKNGGSHLEMQSRSIDSYTHAIHSFQAFDIGDIDFTDNVASMFYDLKTETTYPTFGLTNCVSCHVAGRFNVPDQAKSLPGVFSAADPTPDGYDREIFGVPSYIAGPGSRACGACHRAELIKEDHAVALASFNSHTRTNGYLLEDQSILTVIYEVMAYFEPDVVLPTP